MPKELKVTRPRNPFKIGNYYTKADLTKYFDKLTVDFYNALPWSPSPTLCEFTYNKLTQQNKIQDHQDVNEVYYPGKFQYGEYFKNVTADEFWSNLVIGDFINVPTICHKDDNLMYAFVLEEQGWKCCTWHEALSLRNEFYKRSTDLLDIVLTTDHFSEETLTKLHELGIRTFRAYVYHPKDSVPKELVEVFVDFDNKFKIGSLREIINIILFQKFKFEGGIIGQGKVENGFSSFIVTNIRHSVYSILTLECLVQTQRYFSVFVYDYENSTFLNPKTHYKLKKFTTDEYENFIFTNVYDAYKAIELVKPKEYYSISLNELLQKEKANQYFLLKLI